MGSGGPTPAAGAHKFFAFADFLGILAYYYLNTPRISQMKSICCQVKSTGTAYAIVAREPRG
ncbi:MAG: hypothetical protein VX647_04160, partial [Pseudomonadota bacterium]|nr:hypothetical protein [Pseudomonadota bacterium]